MAEYKSSPGFQEKKARAKALGNQELVKAFEGAYVDATRRGEFQRPSSFPFYETDDDGLHLLESGEWYQALKEEIAARNSSKTDRETAHDDCSALE